MEAQSSASLSNVTIGNYIFLGVGRSSNTIPSSITGATKIGGDSYSSIYKATSTTISVAFTSDNTYGCMAEYQLSNVANVSVKATKTYGDVTITGLTAGTSFIFVSGTADTTWTNAISYGVSTTTGHERIYLLLAKSSSIALTDLDFQSILAFTQ